MIQGPSKLKNYILRRLFKPLRLAKFESFWIRVCAIVAISGISGDGLLISLSFSWQSFLKWFLFWFPLPSSRSFPPIYSVIFRVPGNYWFPCFAPWVPESVLCPSPRRLSFPCFSFFSSFWCCLLESPWLTIYFGVHWFLMSRSSWFSFWPSFLFIFFLKWAESHPAGLKVFCCYSPFYSPLFWFPEYCPLALWEVTPGFLLFLAGSLVPEKDVSILCFLCSFGFSFELS